MNKTLVRNVLIGLVVVGGLLWAVFEFVFKGTVTISGGTDTNVIITTIKGGQVATGKNGSYRLVPGSYMVTGVGTGSGISKTVNISPLSSTTVAIGTTPTLAATLITKLPLYSPIPSTGSIVGFDPSDGRLKRLDAVGNASKVITQNFLAGKEGRFEPEVRSELFGYQPYKNNQVIMATRNHELYVFGNATLSLVNTTDLKIDTSDDQHPLTIATQPQLDSFVIGYKKDVYFYDNVTAAPKKIYTAKKEFNALTYGKDTIGLYNTSVPPSREDLRSTFSDKQVDLLIVNTANKQEQTLPGPIANASLSPEGAYATILTRGESPYLFSISKKQKTEDIAAPLVAGPLWIANTSYLYADNTRVWQHNINNAESVLVGTLPGTVTSLYKEASGSILATTYNNSTNAGTYRLSTPSAATTLADKLASILPYTQDNLTIMYSAANGNPAVVIKTTSQLNNASQLPRYRSESLKLRQAGLDYLKSKGIDTSAVTIMYDPVNLP